MSDASVMRKKLLWPFKAMARGASLRLEASLELYRFYHRQLSELDERIEAFLKTFEDRSADQKVPPPRRAQSPAVIAPEFDVGALLQMTGRGSDYGGCLNGYSALELISEIGTDMAAGLPRSISPRGFAYAQKTRKTGGKDR